MPLRAVIQRTTAYAIHYPRAMHLENWETCGNLPRAFKRLANPPFISDGWFLSPLFNNLAELREIKLQKHKAVPNNQHEGNSKAKTENESSQASADQNQSSEDVRQTQMNDQHDKSSRQHSENNDSNNNLDNQDRYCSAKIARRYRHYSPWFDAMPAWPLRYLEEAMNELTPDNIFNRHIKHGRQYKNSHQENSQCEVQHNSSNATSNVDNVKYCYHKSTTTKSNGEKTTTVTRSLGDRKHTLTTSIDVDGNQQSTEDYINVDENQIQQFEADLKAYSQNEFGKSIANNDSGVQDNAAENQTAGNDTQNATKE